MTSILRSARLLGLTAAFALAALALPAAASAADPTGFWKTIDDDGKTPRSVVHITKDEKGKLVGKIVKLFRKASEKPMPMCDECDEGYKGAKIKGVQSLGLVIMWDVEHDEDNEWENGEILDPANGKTYSVDLELQKAGKKLKVRGYLGVSVLGRTQHWHRTEQPTDTLEIIPEGK